jgi:MATE family multidrug resistance protein
LPGSPISAPWYGSRPAHREVWRLAGPIILSNVTVPLVGIVDTAVVGHLEHVHYIGAVAIGVLVFNFLYWGCGFLRMGTTGPTAQALGAGHWDEVRAVLARALLAATVIGSAMAALQGPIMALAFGLIDASREVETSAEVYVAIRIWAAPAVLGNFVVLGWLLGVQDARSALIVQVFVNLANLGLSLVLVMGLGWAVAGVGTAALIAEYAGFAFGLVVVARKLGRMPGRFLRARIFSAERIARLVLINRDIFLRTLCLIVSFSYFTASGARFGDVVLAANTVLMHFQGIMSYALDGFAHTAEALVGRAVGARDRHRMSDSVRAALTWAGGTSCAFALVFAVAGDGIVAVLTGQPEVRGVAHDYLFWVVLSPVLSVWSYMFDGIFLGATQSRSMRNSMLLAALLFFGATFAFVPWLGNHGLWLSLMVLMAARGITLGLRYPAIVADVPVKRM